MLETIDLLSHTHPKMASILVTHHLEELPATTSHALLISEGKAVAAGPAAETITTDNISFAFKHPIEVERRHGRYNARVNRISPPCNRAAGELVISAA